jgi:lysophospholipase L1-like esterase
MATIQSVDKFLEYLSTGKLSWQQVNRYVEIDPEAPVMRLRMRPDVLSGRIPEGIDVDQLVYAFDVKEQAQKRARRVRTRMKELVVVADGDSWFHLPPIIRPEAIADRIGDDDPPFDVYNLAHWGDTLSKRIAEKQYMRKLANCNADWLILSAGGNDIQISLSKHEFLFPYDATRPLEQAIKPEGGRLLQDITTGYSTIFREVRTAYPTVEIICYAYDYPNPSAAHSEYIGKYLKVLQYAIGTWSQLVRVIMHRLEAAVMSAAAAFPGVAYLDCFGVAQPYPWFDDMHPDTKGFRALAKWYEARMTRATHTLSLKRVRLPVAAREHGRRSRKGK